MVVDGDEASGATDGDEAARRRVDMASGPGCSSLRRVGARREPCSLIVQNQILA